MLVAQLRPTHTELPKLREDKGLVKNSHKLPDDKTGEFTGTWERKDCTPHKYPRQDNKCVSTPCGSTDDLIGPPNV